jgi:hypothetical protein
MEQQKHIFKVQLINSDLFISGVDLINKTLTYQLRDKYSGKLLEPEFKNSKFTVNSSQAHFDSRFINLDLLTHIQQVLN